MSLIGTYDLNLVALSLVIATLTAYTALDLAGRVTASSGSSRLFWLFGGAGAMGSGIWCMHYTGMLAFHLPIPVFYHLPTVLLSLLAAVVASWIALYIVSRKRMTAAHVLTGGLLMGAAIAVMHYTGMAAMRMQAMHRYNTGLVVLSVVLAVVISAAGLLLIFHSREGNRGWKVRTASSVVLGLAIPVMHYSGMAAVHFVAMPSRLNLTHSVDISSLATFAIVAITCIVLGLSLMTALVDRRLTAQDLLLHGERKMLRALIDNIPDFMYVKDLEGRFVIANPEIARCLGRSSVDELIGRTDFDFFPERLARAFRQDEILVQQSGVGISSYEEVFIGPDGNEIPLLTTKVPLHDDRGTVIGIAGVGRNISERKRSELALRQAEARFRGIFDEAIIGIFQLDHTCRLVVANPALATIFGYKSPAQLIAARPREWHFAADPKRHLVFLDLIETQGRVQNFEAEVFRQDLSTIWISSSVRAVCEDGALIRYEGMIEDVTERKLLREQLLQAQKLESVGQLAAGIAHEINTPTQYIGDNVRFLRDMFADLTHLLLSYERLRAAAQHSVQTGTLDPTLLADVVTASSAADLPYLLEEIPKAIDQSLEGITRVAGLVSAMKEFSHPGTKEKIPLDLNHAIESTIAVARSEWKYVADMQTAFDPTVPLVSCLPGEFNQVILNLIVNAAHAIAETIGTQDKGHITVLTRNSPPFVEIRISDTGGGIPEQIRGRVFDPFFTTKEIGKGTGQGLAIARSVIVDKHAGSLEFESIVGQGTTFIIRLPHDRQSTAKPNPETFAQHHQLASAAR